MRFLNLWKPTHRGVGEYANCIVAIRLELSLSGMTLSSTSPLAPTPHEWFLMWRTRGLAVDRLLADAFAVPAFSEEALRERVPRAVQVPTIKGRTVLTEKDKECVRDVASFATGFVAKMLPTQVLLTDAKPHLPPLASKLAVASVEGENVFIGSFDLVVRIRSGLSKGPWRRWNGKDGAIDLKVTGASAHFGLNSSSMRRYLMHGRLVLMAARKIKGSPIGACSFAAYLIRRPAGPLLSSRGGKCHAGDYGLAAYDVQSLIDWNPATSGSETVSGPRQPTDGRHMRGDWCTRIAGAAAALEARASESMGCPAGAEI